MPFSYPPTPALLNWLSGQQLANRLGRSLRWWVILQRLYGTEHSWAIELPSPFSYGDLRDRLFAPQHPKLDQLSAVQIQKFCRQPDCICHWSVKRWIEPFLDEGDGEAWRQEMQQQTGRSPEEIEAFWQERPFAVVHRVLRDDLKRLVASGWLRSSGRGQFVCCTDGRLPSPPEASVLGSGDRLGRAQTLQVLRVLEDVSFVQPGLNVVINQLWEQVNRTERPWYEQTGLPKHIFMHLDYIFPDEVQDRVDGYQETIENLWRLPEGGVVMFEYGRVQLSQGRIERKTIVVYPVCFHYARRAKYLSGYGIDPDGELGWHNYRLDRILSDHVSTLPWGDECIPQALKEKHRTGELPTSVEVEEALQEAWGLNFYEERQLLIMRFPAEFARWYVKDTIRHQTFQPIAYSKLPGLVKQCVRDRTAAKEILRIIQQKPPTDSYFCGWIRVPDINITMRLRDWRPNGEVIAPLEMRSQMRTEAELELRNYQDI